MPAVVCTSCGATLDAPDALIGKRAKCAACGTVLMIGAPPPPAAAPQPAPASMLADFLAEDEAYDRARPAPPKPVMPTPESQSGEENPYRATQATSRQRRKSDNDAPKEVLKHIKQGAIAAVISGTLTLVFTVVVVFMKQKDLTGVIDAAAFIDVALIYLLAWGIYMKSRTAATLMFVYFLGAKLYAFSLSHSVQSIPISLIFLVVFFRAMVATFQYHKFINARDRDD